MTPDVLLASDAVAPAPPDRSAPARVPPSVLGSHPADVAAVTRALEATPERATKAAHAMLVAHVARQGEGSWADARVEIRGDAGCAGVTGLGFVASGDTSPLAVGLVADPLVLLVLGIPNAPALHWTVLPGGETVTARADALRALRSMAARAELTLVFDGEEALAAAVDGGRWDLDDEWRLFEDLACLEEWSGVAIPMPSEVTAEAATEIGQAAAWVRAGRIPVEIHGPLELTTPERVGVALAEVRVSREFAADVLGRTVPLGTGRARVELRNVQLHGAGLTAEPASPRAVFWLLPPAGRRLPPVRTQAMAAAASVAPAESPAPPKTVSVARPATRSLADVLAALHRTPPNGRQADTVLDEIRADRAV